MPERDQEARIAALEKNVAALMARQNDAEASIREDVSALKGEVSLIEVKLSQVAGAACTGTRGMDVAVIFEIGESFDDEGQPLFTTSGPVSMRVDYLRLLLDQYSAMSSITRR